MAKGSFVGEFEQLVLLALLRLGDEGYGLTVRDLIEERTGRNAGIGSVYATLDRLHRKGLVESRLASPTPVRGGRAKKCFSVTAQGEEALHQALAMVEHMRAGLEFGSGRS